MKISSKNIKEMEAKIERNSVPLAGEYTAITKEIKAMVFKKGGFGLKFTYGLTSEAVKGRKISEYIQLRKADGTAQEYADERLISRFRAFGLTNEEIAAVDIPDSHTETGDLDTLLGKRVVLKLEQSSYNGKPSTDVKGVYLPGPRNDRSSVKSA